MSQFLSRSRTPDGTWNHFRGAGIPGPVPPRRICDQRPGPTSAASTLVAQHTLRTRSTVQIPFVRILDLPHGPLPAAGARVT